MDERRRKFLALMHLAELLPRHPALMVLIGFFIGRLDRVYLTLPQTLPKAAEVRIFITTPRAAIWTGRWFRGWIGEAAVPDPSIMVSALTERDVDLYVAVDFGAQVPSWFEEALYTPTVADGSPATQLEELRQRVDHALDVYNECRKMLSQPDEQRERELRFLLELARQEVQQLGAELGRLKAELPAAP